MKKALNEQIKIPADLKEAIRKESADLDLYEYEVVERAWQAYARAKGARVSSPFDHLKDDERELLLAVLHVKRTRPPSAMRLTWDFLRGLAKEER